MSCTTPESSSTCKRLVPALLLALVSGQSLAAAAAETSDPIRLGVMQGFAPAMDKRATSASFNSMVSALLPAVL
jgi:hypothetical protein